MHKFLQLPFKVVFTNMNVFQEDNITTKKENEVSQLQHNFFLKTSRLISSNRYWNMSIQNKVKLGK